MHQRKPAFVLSVVGLAAMVPLAPGSARQGAGGQGLYQAGCAKCHGDDGQGVDHTQVAFTAETPDFTDCSFSSREPDPDWIAVAHQGGPIRAFDQTMPAFGEAFSQEQLQSIIDHIRGFCSDPRWPRGELNLPRPFLTEKAYPEDEAVFVTEIATDGPGGVVHEFVYEKRFGPVNQIEVKVPFGVRNVGMAGAGSDWATGLGNIEIGFKRAVFHSLASGAIVSLGGEVSLPTRTGRAGLGGDDVSFEPFVAVGKILGTDGFFHGQALVEIPTGDDSPEAIGRFAVGRSYTSGEWGRTWSPMIELQVASELEAGGATFLDVVPQLQLTLNTRQHVIGSVGVRIPANRRSRPTEILVYVLWDWFDGGFFDGW